MYMESIRAQTYMVTVVRGYTYVHSVVLFSTFLVTTINIDFSENFSVKFTTYMVTNEIRGIWGISSPRMAEGISVIKFS